MSLLEALVAPAILATALLTLAQVLAAAGSATAAAGRTTHAALLASQKVEQLRASRGAIEAGSDVPEAGFTREWSVAPLPLDPDHLAVIAVAVRTGGRETRMVAVAPRLP